MLLGYFMMLYDLLQLCDNKCRISIAYSKVLFWHLPCKTKKNHKKLIRTPELQQDSN